MPPSPRTHRVVKTYLRPVVEGELLPRETSIKATPSEHAVLQTYLEIQHNIGALIGMVPTRLHAKLIACSVTLYEIKKEAIGDIGDIGDFDL